MSALSCLVLCVLRRLYETVAVTHIEYTIFKAERALLILRQVQHCTFPHENCEHQKHWSKHNSPSKTLRPFISFILHLTWEGTLMWNCLMIYCDWCLNACMSILCQSPVFYLFIYLFSPFFLLLCVSPERAL